jgi:hypothetical protein
MIPFSALCNSTVSDVGVPVQAHGHAIISVVTNMTGKYDTRLRPEVVPRRPRQNGENHDGGNSRNGTYHALDRAFDPGRLNHADDGRKGGILADLGRRKAEASDC